MGKVAQRLARRNNPAFATARQLAKLARDLDDGFADDEITRVLADELESRSTEQFNELMDQVWDELTAHDYAEDNQAHVDTLARLCCERQETGDGEIHHLAAWPMRIAHPQAAWLLQLSPEQMDRIAALMKAHGLVREDARVTVLPRMLSSVISCHMRHGSIFGLTRALGCGFSELGLNALNSALDDMGAKLESREPSSTALASFGALVFVVTAADDDEPAFPLSFEMFRAVAEALSPADQAEALEDTRSALKAAASELALVLGAETCAPVTVVGTWMEGTRTLARTERVAQASSELDALVESNGGDLQALCADVCRGKVGEQGMETVRLALFRADGGEPIGDIEWPRLAFEFEEDAIGSLANFLNEREVRDAQDVFGGESSDDDDDDFEGPEPLVPPLVGPASGTLLH